MSKYLTKNTLIIAGILFGLSWMMWVWPTPYRYFKIGITNVRVNRFTGTPQYLRAGGWGY